MNCVEHNRIESALYALDWVVSKQNWLNFIRDDENDIFFFVENPKLIMTGIKIIPY